jgi:glycosyltransferase involved in cell wall biosynthesis
MSKGIAIIGIRGYPPTFPGAGGIDVYVQRSLPEFTRRKINVTLFTRSWAKPVREKQSEYISIRTIPTIHTKHLDTPIYAILASILVCFSQVEVVWFHAPGSAIFAFLPRLCGKRIHLTIHGVDWQRKKWGATARMILKFAEWLSIHSAHERFVVSEELREYVKNHYRKEPELKVVELFESKKMKPRRIKTMYGLVGEDFILYLGRFVPEKRIEWLIRAFIESEKINRKMRLVLAGKVENDRYGKKLRDLAKGDKKIIWTGFVTGEVKSELLSNCKLFALPSSLEGYSLALAEALSYDRNCLVSNLQIHRELGKASKAIITFERNSYEDFLRLLERGVRRK